MEARGPQQRSTAGFPSDGASPQPGLSADAQDAEPAGHSSRHRRRPQGRGLGPAPRGRGRCSRPTLRLLLLTRGGRTMPPGVEALDLPAWNGASGRSWGPRGRSVPPRRSALPRWERHGLPPPPHSTVPPGGPRRRPLPEPLSSWGLPAAAPPLHLTPPPPASASLPPAPGFRRGPPAYTWKKSPRAQVEKLSASSPVRPARPEATRRRW